MKLDRTSFTSEPSSGREPRLLSERFVSWQRQHGTFAKDRFCWLKDFGFWGFGLSTAFISSRNLNPLVFVCTLSVPKISSTVARWLGFRITNQKSCQQTHSRAPPPALCTRLGPSRPLWTDLPVSHGRTTGTISTHVFIFIRFFGILRTHDWIWTRLLLRLCGLSTPP